MNTILGNYFPTAFSKQNLMRKEDTTMKKYIAPEMKALAFVAENAVAAPLPGSQFNDGQFGEWD